MPIATALRVEREYMNCMTCKLANWNRTKSGRLHPDGTGRCMWKMPEFAIPFCVSFQAGRSGDPPKMYGGSQYISREERYLRDCAAWEPTPTALGQTDAKGKAI